MNNFNGLTENIFFENILNYNITYNYQTSFNTPNNYEPTILQSNLIIIDDTLSQLQDDIQDIMFYVNELEYIQEYSRQIVYDRVKYNNNLNYNMCVICQDNFSENESHVIPGLISRMHRAKFENKDKFEVWGTGTPLREFLFIDDLASAIEFIIVNNVDPGLYNIGSNQEVTIKSLVENVKDVVNFPGEIVFDQTKPDGNPRKLLDSSKFTNFGWKPAVDLTEGLKITYDWFLENIA